MEPVVDKLILRIIAGATTVIYLAFYLWDRKTIDDEREQLIELKAAELQQWTSTAGLVITTAAYLYHPRLDAIYPILVFALTSAYAHMLGKAYYRRNM